MLRLEEEEALPGTCPQNVELKWMTEVSSSIYATPLITDLYSDGRKDIIVPSFVHYLEVSTNSCPLRSSNCINVFTLMQSARDVPGEQGVRMDYSA